MFLRYKKLLGWPFAFTLIELMVVISVIVILMTLLVPVLQKLREKNAITETRALVDSLSMALDRYRTVWNVYPPDKTPLLDKSSEALVSALSGSSIVWGPSTPATYPWRNNAYYDSSGTGRATYYVFYDFKDSDLADLDGDKAPELVDHWGKRLVYNAGTTSSDTQTNQYGVPRHGLKKYDLFSAGPNKTFGPDPTTGVSDDVTSWGATKDVFNEYNYTTLFNSTNP